MHALKTGALIQAAVRLGAGCGRLMSADENDALDRYASAIGLGFQIVDDVLDVEGTATSLGKTAGKDAMQRKTTYASLLGLSAARERIDALRADARCCSARLRDGAAADRARRLGRGAHPLMFAMTIRWRRPAREYVSRSGIGR